MAIIVFTAEKTREASVQVTESLLEAAARIGEPRGFKAALIVYGDGATPLVDPTEDWSPIPKAYVEAPVLGKSPDLLEALRETLETLMLEPGHEPKIAVITWSASVKPRYRVDLAVKSLEALGATVKILATRPSLPGWIKHHPIIAEKTLTYRANMNVEKLYEKLITP
ncbi:MAG: hypothetical protein P3X22_004635 [Thermoprotei archaeon]|nr:hypothetical protein [Thermoprotei archaeon]